MPSSIHYVAVRLAGMVRSHAHDDDQAHNGIGHITTIALTRYAGVVQLGR
jgi:hypothetical protein